MPTTVSSTGVGRVSTVHSLLILLDKCKAHLFHAPYTVCIILCHDNQIPTQESLPLMTPVFYAQTCEFM